jgi:MFS family permease
MTNPYSPPTADIANPREEPGSPIKAIVLGLMVDIGGTLISGLAFGFVYAVVLTVQGDSPEAVTGALVAINEAGWAIAVLTTLGCLFSVLGGYVCARISRRTDYRLGWILAGLSLLLGFLLAGGSHSLVEGILMSGLTVASVLLGVKLGMPAFRA